MSLRIDGLVGSLDSEMPDILLSSGAGYIPNHENFVLDGEFIDEVSPLNRLG
jgi:hypothetical protein